MSNVGVRKPSWVLLNIRALLGVLVGCLSSFAGAAPVTEPPFATGVLGSLAPADFYAVDVATDPAGNVYAIDPFYSSISRYGADGVLQLRIDDPAFRWLRGLTVDSQGRMYVLDPTQGFIRIYSAAGSLLDVWYGFIGGESMGVDQNDNIYVALGGAREGTPEVVVYDTAGTELLRFGSLGGGLGQLNRPIDVAVAPDGSMYVVEEANQRVQKFDASGNPLFTIGTTGQAGSAPGEFRAPVSVAVDSKGDWYVSDRRNYRVQKFDSAGNFLLEWGAKGNGPGLFNEQNGITVAPDDTVWVAGYHGHDIQHFDGQGNFLEQWQGNVSGPGEFSQARGIALVGNTLFAVDGWNQRVQAFDVATGQYTFEFGERGQGDATVFNFPRAMTAGPGGDLYISDDDNVRRIRTDGTFVMRYPRPSGPRPGALGLEASADGFLYMTSQGNNEVVKYDAASGVIISRWGSQGSGPGQFKTPRGVVVDSTGTVYVADTGNGRVQLFTTDGQYLAEWGKGATDPIKLSGAGALAIDEVRGLLYVADIWANRVVAYNLQGEVQFYWGTEGVGEGQFRNIYGIEVDGEGTVYVSERDNGRIQKFSYPVSFPTTGQPTYNRGSDLGYFLWQDADDGEWHLRWSGDGILHQFQMTITNTTGGIANVRPYSFEGGDFLTQNPNELSITALAGSWIDGVDFFASPGAVLKFDLRIDGVADAAKVFMGGAGINPSSNPAYVSQAVPAQDVFSISGTPAYLPGKTLGYYLWQDAIDGGWHLRWNSDGPAHKFSGSILATGPISGVLPFELEAQDQYTVGNFVLSFKGFASVWHDGLDFRVPDGSTLVLNMAIDGIESPAQVFVGGGLNSPTVTPFSLVSIPAVSAADPSGKPPFIGGGDLGYFIWVDSGNVWHVRANPDGVMHTFAGSITSEVLITSLTPVGVESNDVLNQTSGQAIEWNLSALSWYDGFDFTVQSGGRVMFDVSLDGVAADTQTFIGLSRANPEQNPFALWGQ